MALYDAKGVFFGQNLVDVVFDVWELLDNLSLDGLLNRGLQLSYARYVLFLIESARIKGKKVDSLQNASANA